MRTVITFHPDCTSDAVSRCLGVRLPAGSDPTPELRHIASIDLYTEQEAVLEMPELYAEIVQRLGGNTLAIAADISGRVDGAAEAKSVCVRLLTEFGGFALDGYSEHLWTLDELVLSATYRGHHFFDTAGWYRETIDNQPGTQKA